MEDNEKNVSKDTKYNLDGATFELIGDMQRSAVSLALKKRYDESFNRWVAIRTLVESCFEDDESEQLNKLENHYNKIILLKIPNGLSEQKPFQGFSERKTYIRNGINKIKSIRLNKYSRTILRLMKSYNITLTGKEIKTELN